MDEKQVEAAQRQACQQWQAKRDLFRDLFPWLGVELKKLAGLAPDAPVGPGAPNDDNLAIVNVWNLFDSGSRSGRADIIALRRRADEEWEKLTGLPPLGDRRDWKTALTAARDGAYVSDKEFTSMTWGAVAEEIRCWALALKASQDRAKATAADAPVADGGDAGEVASGEQPAKRADDHDNYVEANNLYGIDERVSNWGAMQAFLKAHPEISNHSKGRRRMVHSAQFLKAIKGPTAFDRLDDAEPQSLFGDGQLFIDGAADRLAEIRKTKAAKK